MLAQYKSVQNSILPHLFDTDSSLIGIEKLQPTNRVIRGFAGTKTNNVQMGTIHWRIEDDQGIKIELYHSDNGIFKSKAWQDHCYNNGQGLTFAGVNAHHQNGKAERRIRKLQDMARTMLIHAKHRWPSAITANLWPYAIRMANDVLNSTPSSKFPDGRIPISKSNVATNLIHWQPFGCPVYVLSATKQTTGIQNKWAERSKVGIYLGRSPQHAQSVALVLNLDTGLVSPQFHVTFDPTFQTMRKTFQNNMLISQWQYKAGFVNKQDDTTILASETKQRNKSVTKQTKLHRLPQLSIQDEHHHAPEAQDQFTSSMWETPISISEQVEDATSNISVPEGYRKSINRRSL
jgi:hypothetical protein